MPTLASSSRAQVRYIEESVFGVTPATGTARELRVTGESLDYGIQTTSSEEIRADRMTTDLVVVGAQASGGLNFELSYNEFDTLLAATLQGSWLTAGAGGEQTITATFASPANTITASTGTPFANVSAGQWIKISGAVNAANNGYVRVLTKTSATVLVLDKTLVAETSTASVKVSASRLVNGATQRSYSIEKRFADVGQFFVYRGMTASRMALNFQSGSLVTGSFEFMGKDSERKTESFLPGTPTASQTGTIMNAVSGVGAILENGTPLSNTTFISSLSLNVDNTLRMQNAVGVLGAAGIGSGTLKVTGSMEVYFADGTLYDKLVNNTDSSLVWTVFDKADGSGGGYAFNLPKIKFTEGRVQAGAINQDVMATMGFEAILSPAANAQILVDRFGPATVV